MSNKFNTTPNGTTVLDINIVLAQSDTLILDPNRTPYLDNIFLSNPTVKTFVLMPGSYNIISVLKLKSNIRLIGFTGKAEDVHIYQLKVLDGISLMGSNIVLQDISVHCEYSLKVSLTTASVNNTVVTGCHFYGSPDYFAVFYAGPSYLLAGQSTIDAYNTYALDIGNVFYNNVIYTTFSGDGVSFSLQYMSQFVNNIIRGSKLAVYMCRTTNIYGNTFFDSLSNAIYLSFPSDNIPIIGNKIYNSSHSGIKMANQLEHGAFTPSDYNILIKHNLIFGSKLYAIEMNNSNDIKIVNNKLVSGQTMGIYSYSGTKINVSKNKIAYFMYGIFLERTSGSVVDSNKFTSIYPYVARSSIKVANDGISTSNMFSNNTMNGFHIYGVIDNNSLPNSSLSNIMAKYYSMSDEKIYEIN